MYKACGRCGKIHKWGYTCTKGKEYKGGEERKLRNTYKWEKKSKEIRAGANWLCAVCRDNGIYTYNDLEVHHIEKLRERPDLLLDDENLICLCREHHKQADSGELSKDYLKSLVHRADGDIPPGV